MEDPSSSQLAAVVGVARESTAELPPLKTSGSPSFASYATSRENNYDLVRFLLALTVLFAHGFHAVNDTGVYYDPLVALTHGQLQLGHLAVQGFFAISGVLVVASWERSKTVFEFLLKRVLRIYPGFIVCYLLCLLVVAPLSGLSWQEYRAQLHLPVAMLKMLLLRGFGGFYTFPNNPLHMLNTSLWTIPYEFGCYLMVAMIGIFGARWRGAILIATGLAYARCVLFELHSVDALRALPEPIHRVATMAALLPATREVCFFLFGATFYVLKERIPFSGSLALLSAAALLITSQIAPLLGFVLPFALSYLVFFIVYHPQLAFHGFGKRADLSYGIYLYGWPVQQLLVRVFEGRVNGIALFALAAPTVCVIAELSWKFVERPFLRWRSSRSRLPAGAVV